MMQARTGETRDLALRQGSARIREARQRLLPTKHGHARHCLSSRRAIRGYQSDSSSKRPAIISPPSAHSVQPVGRDPPGIEGEEGRDHFALTRGRSISG